MSHRLRLALSSTLIVALGASLLAPPAGADTATEAATTWLAAQQLEDGGFELAAFPPFETPDAILAIAEDAQTTATWNTTAAFDAVQALDGNGVAPGGTPLHWADDFLSSAPPSAGIAAKFIALVAVPLGVSTTAFDPAADGSPVNLEALMDAGELADHSYGAGALNATLYALLAHALLDRPAPDDTIAYVRDAQQANGAWTFTGDASGADLDIDTTALAISALTANGVPAGDAAVAAAMKFLADQHRPSGAWQAFGANDPNSTATALIGVSAAGWDPTVACWRTASSSAAPTTGFVSPETWLRGRQITLGATTDVGRFRSPGDGFGVNTFATSQSVQGILRSWLPVAEAAQQPDAAFTDVPDCVWYSQAVGWEADNGVTRFTTGTFGPKKPITNGQLAAMLWATMDSPAGAPDHGFTDVPANAFYNDALDWGTDAGVLIASGATYQPKREVPRARMAYALWQMAGTPTAPDIAVSDVPNGAYYADAVDWAVDTGVITLLPNGRFLPKNILTRAQAANMLFRLASTEPAWGDVPLPSTIEFTP